MVGRDELFMEYIPKMESGKNRLPDSNFMIALMSDQEEHQPPKSHTNLLDFAATLEIPLAIFIERSSILG